MRIADASYLFSEVIVSGSFLRFHDELENFKGHFLFHSVHRIMYQFLSCMARMPVPADTQSL